MIEFSLIRSDRRTLGLTVDGQGKVVARAPRRMPLKEIHTFVKAKSDWIAQKQALVGRRNAAFDLGVIKEGTLLPYLGQTVRVALDDVPRGELAGTTLRLPKNGDPAQSALLWFAHEAARELPPKVTAWAERMGVFPSRLSIGHALRRWGSMSSQGAMRLNVALMHCPLELIDYVIVHELAHRVHPDHSPAFHQYVQSVLPNQKTLVARLKEQGPCLTLLRGDNRREDA